jgi:hypothetical protein
VFFVISGESEICFFIKNIRLERNASSSGDLNRLSGSDGFYRPGPLCASAARFPCQRGKVFL